MGAFRRTAVSATPPSADSHQAAGPVCVAYSGGRDSTALLHATLASAPPGVEVLALHVHHGLSPLADDWLNHCRTQCATWSCSGTALRFVSRQLTTRPTRGASIEAWARSMRYEALREMALAHDSDIVMLAHHRRDQAESFLLQALRGAGVAGLAGMPRSVRRDGILWLRPWLERPRSEIEAYVHKYQLDFIDDHSNAEPRFARSRLRVQAWPALSAAFPQAESTLADSARWAQEADACLAELAAIDLQAVQDADEGLLIDRWFGLSTPRRGNALRAWLKDRLGRAAPSSLVRRLLAELHPRSVAQWEVEGAVLRSYRGVLRMAQPDVSPVAESSSRETVLTVGAFGDYPLPGWAGSIRVAETAQGGVPLALLGELELGPVQGAVKFQSGPGRPARSLKKQFQAAGVPAWDRHGPLVYTAGHLLFVPGLGIDARRVAPPGQMQASMQWLPYTAGKALRPAG